MNSNQVHLIQNLLYSNNKFIKLVDSQKQEVNNFLLKEMNTANMRYKDLLNDDKQATPIFKLILKNTYDFINKLNKPIDANSYRNQKIDTFNEKYNEKQLEYNSLNLAPKPKEINFAIEDNNSNDNVNKLLELEIQKRNEIARFDQTEVENANKWINNDNGNSNNINIENTRVNSIRPDAKVLKIHNTDKHVRFEEVEVNNMEYKIENKNENKEDENNDNMFNNFLNKLKTHSDETKELNQENYNEEQTMNIAINTNEINNTTSNYKIENIENQVNEIYEMIKKLDNNIEKMNEILNLLKEKIL